MTASFREPPREARRGGRRDAGDVGDRASRLLGEALDEMEAGAAEDLSRPTRPFSIAIWIGAALIVVELLSLGVLYGSRRVEITERIPELNRLLVRNDCRGEIYRTYRKIAAYADDHGGRPPDSLAELVGPYSAVVPADPVTSRPLFYAKEGARLVLRCR